MMVELCVLASGSKGNCTLVKAGESAVLIDAGLSAKEVVRRLKEAGTDIGQVAGICISHEHSDHTTGLAQLASRYGVPVFANRGTVDALEGRSGLSGLPWNVFSTGQAFAVGGCMVEPFSVPHDAYEPVGFVVAAGGIRVGVVTDMGIVTSLITARLQSCRAVVVEANHDEDMLRLARRPEFLKQRIRGRQGHLSNKAAADLLARIANEEMNAAYLAHLSEDCNRPDVALQLARVTLKRAGHPQVDVRMTYPDRISEIWRCET